MERASSSPLRLSLGFVLGILLPAVGFWMRQKAVGDAAKIGANFDFSGALEKASTMSRNVEVGLFLIVVGGLILLMSFWRWLSPS